ncbi:hypothetical protein AVEN_173238-1 [Araneus ventricosus]|uniref:Uncharacterized protein n=1 Tax=Araneus ventricosus TaxID=182803 RepID=A0A4Y2H1T0_ARAVE|nr:hypothetical protein AVEN_173238-1 [Araneus ventricosus]
MNIGSFILGLFTVWFLQPTPATGGSNVVRQCFAIDGRQLVSSGFDLGTMRHTLNFKADRFYSSIFVKVLSAVRIYVGRTTSQKQLIFQRRKVEYKTQLELSIICSAGFDKIKWITVK